MSSHRCSAAASHADHERAMRGSPASALCSAEYLPAQPGVASPVIAGAMVRRAADHYARDTRLCPQVLCSNREPASMSVFDEPKIDCHNHILDPARFPYHPDTLYRPAGQEITPAEQLFRVMDVYGVHGALVVGPNSGYGSDNRCLLDAIARSQGRLKGIAV